VAEGSGLHDCFTTTSFALDKVISTAGTAQSNPTPVSIQERSTRSKRTMKINRFIAMAAIALMAIGAMGFFSTRTHAQGVNPPAPQVQGIEAPDNEQASLAPDTDTIDEQVGDQTGVDTATEAASLAPDTDTVQEQVGDQTGPDTAAESATELPEAPSLK
jgi:hypothetical protein